jgi:hypothetical protein
LLDEAAATDEAEDTRHGPARGDELPEELRDPLRRRQVIDELIGQAGQDPDGKRGRRRARKAGQAARALDLLDELQANAAHEAQQTLAPAIARVERAEQALVRLRTQVQAAADERAAREAAAAAQGRTLPGTRPVPVGQHARVRKAVARLDRDRQRLTQRQAALVQVTGKRNLTDPHSRFMPVRGGGFILGYNAQLAVSADHLILAVDLVQDTGDVHQLVPMLNRLDHAVTVLREATANPDLTVGVALFDAGYDSADNRTAPGPDRLIALGKRDNIAGDDPPTNPPGTDATPRQQMAWRLATPPGKTLYKKRGATVEPVNGHLKDPRGLRRFARRGLTAAKAELTLAALTTNLLRLHTRQTTPHTA